MRVLSSIGQRLLSFSCRQGCVSALLRRITALAAGILRCLQHPFSRLGAYLWKKRFGVPAMMGLRLLPRVPCIYPHSLARAELERYLRKDTAPLEGISIFGNGAKPYDGLIVYPPQFDWSDRTAAVLYHNPGSGIAGRTLYDIEQIAKLRRRPVVCYDYRGMGMNTHNGNLLHTPDPLSLQEDAYRALKWTLGRFTHVEVFGASLGGCVGAIGLARLLKERPLAAPRLSFTALDIYSSTSDVLPEKLAFIASLFKRDLPTLKAVHAIAESRIPLRLLYHKHDSVLPKTAQVATSETLKKYSHIEIHKSRQYEHADLSCDLYPAFEN